jgi:hypothetical protein
MSTQLSQISFTILPAIQLHPTYKPNPHNPANHHLPFDTLQITYPEANTQGIQPKTEPNNPPPPPPQNQESFQQGTNFSTFRTIHTITGGSNMSFENKRQRREYYHQVNHVAITFNEDVIKFVSFLHTDAIVIIAHIDKWDVT